MKQALILLLIFSAFRVGAQDSEWQWAHALGGEKGVNNQFLCADGDGNTYATASYYGPSVTFGLITLQNANANTEDIFLVKYNSMVRWFGRKVSEVSEQIVSPASYAIQTTTSLSPDQQTVHHCYLMALS